MPNKYTCSNGERISQATIDRRRAETYRKAYANETHPSCSGCMARAQGTAHIVPQSVAKSLGKAELCWNVENMFPACHRCNSIAENVSSEAITKLLNYEEIKRVLNKYDPERASKLLK